MSAPEFSLFFSSSAKQDVSDILAYTLTHWGQNQLTHYKAILNQAFLTLAQNPDIGRKRYGLLVAPAARHRIFYRIEQKTVFIVRILHERMDAEHHVSAIEE